MNNSKGYIFIGLILLMLSACETDEVSNNDDQMTAQEIEEANSIAASGAWTITNYNDDGQDETSDYAGYLFSFEAAGILKATKGNVTLTGTWSVAEDSSNSNSDDGSNDDIDFNIFFPVSDDHNFDDLSDDWDIVSIDASTIHLIDTSGGNGGTDRLTFNKE